MSSGAKSIDEELVCIDALVQRIRYVCPGEQIQTQREKHDPPDFWMTENGIEYAVEVTSVVTNEGYDAHCRTLLKEIRGRFSGEDAPNGTYAVYVFRTPEIPKRSTKPWNQLLSDAVGNVKAMSDSPSGKDIRLLEMESGYLSVSKLTEAGNTVCLFRTPEGLWEGEVRTELSQLIQDAVRRKQWRCEEKGLGGAGSGVLLVLYDAYGYGDADDALQALKAVEDYNWFHSIFWAASFTDQPNVLYPDSPGRSGVFLYSRNPLWR